MKLRFALRSPLIFNFQFLIMNDPVVQLCQLGIVPAVGCPHQVAGDALQLVDMLAAALRALTLSFRRGLRGFHGFCLLNPCYSV